SCIDNNMAAFVVDRQIASSRFVHYALTNFRFGSLVAVGALPSLNGTHLRTIPLLVPPTLAEQERVVEALSHADELIASLRKLIDKKRAIKQGLMQELLTGRIRLDGFSGEWASLTFEQAVVTVNTRNSRVDASRYGESGTIPVIDQGKAYVAGYVDTDLPAIQPGQDGLLVFGDHTTITKFVDFVFVVGADGTKVLRSRRTDAVKIRFIAYLLELNPVEATGYNRHFGMLRERMFLLPDVDEQRQIVAALSDADDEIAALERRLESARAIKQGMMQELLTGRTRLTEEVAAWVP
ncbi:hypothetical protein, partial [Humibacter sp.]|uniref:hypothetical protein n=1 Tax=Humibacter sp. TaxID=1940291 RepID=UPI003F7CEE04